MPTNTTIFEPANRAIIEDLKRELRAQGHYLTGALEASLKTHEVNENGGVVLTAEALGYLQTLEDGIPASQIGFDAKSIAEMTRYVELRMGYKGKYAIKVALLILKKQSKDGNPTKGSYAYTKTGFRTEAVKDSFETNQPRYLNLLDMAAIGSLDQSFNTIKSGTI
jgi:hypothetical protein